MRRPPKIEVEQTAAGFVVRCSVHGVLRPEPGKVWMSHLGAGVAAGMHSLLAFHGKGAR